MLRLVLVALALMLVSPADAAAKDIVLVKLRDGGPAAKPARAKATNARASKRKVAKKRQARAAHAKKAKRVTKAKPKRKRPALRPMP